MCLILPAPVTSGSNDAELAALPVIGNADRTAGPHPAVARKTMRNAHRKITGASSKSVNFYLAAKAVRPPVILSGVEGLLRYPQVLAGLDRSARKVVGSRDPIDGLLDIGARAVMS